MGVRCLTSFIDDHPQLLKDYKLCNTPLLIDGNNLYYFLYYNYFDINVIYGGDYDNYANSIHYFFQTLHTCNVTPYVVFDGGYDVDDRKLQTTLRRAGEKLRNVSNLAKGQAGMVLPLLAYDVFRQVLDDMGVRHMTCDFEADGVLASLANRWKIPLLSNDSDFYVYDIPAGFIVLDYINLEMDEIEEQGTIYKYINVQMYKLDNLIASRKGLLKEVVPLFATLLGNDFVNPEIFECFYARVKFPKVTGPRGSARRGRVMALLMWLAGQDSLSLAIDKILSFLPLNQREKTKSLIEISINFYTDLESTLKDYFSVKDIEQSKPKSQLKTYGGNPVPHWIITKLRRARMPLIVINTLTLHRNFMSHQVGLLTEPSSYTNTRNVRQILYTILVSLDQKLNERPAAKKDKRPKENYVEEFDRVGRDIKCCKVSLLSEMPDGSPIPYLQQIPHLTLSERKNIFILCAGMDPEILKDIPQCLHFLVTVMIFWIRNAKPKISVLQLYSLLGSVIKLMAFPGHMYCWKSEPVNMAVQTENNIGDEDRLIFPATADNSEPGATTPFVEFRGKLVESCSTSEKDFAKNNLEKFTVATTHSASNKFRTIVTHNCSQFQAAFQALMQLNMLLLSPLFCPSPSVIYNGTVAYNLCVELQKRTQPKTYIPELLGLKSPLTDLYHLLADTVLSSVKEDDFVSDVPKGKKRLKSKKKEVKSDDSDENEKEKENPQEPLRAKCTLTNRFQGLSLDLE